MKTLYLIFSILLFIILSHPIRADTIIDSVYSVPELDGDMCYTPPGQFWSLNTWTYAMSIGDLGDSSIPFSPPSNSTTRAFLSFELPEVPIGYEIDSVSIRLYQFWALGGYPTQEFPVWNVAGGDTIKCILNHIDYGYELDAEDWEKGDIGNPYTFTHNAGTVTESGEDGYRYLDITDYVLYDYQQERILTQYRISFQIDTDWDDHPDFVSFTTSEYYNIGKPQLKLYLSNEVGLEYDVVYQYDINLFVYPNPTSKNCRIMLYSKKPCSFNLKIYNIKGQLVQTLFKGNTEREEIEIFFDIGKLSNGIYFLKAISNKQVVTKKILIIH